MLVVGAALGFLLLLVIGAMALLRDGPTSSPGTGEQTTASQDAGEAVDVSPTGAGKGLGSATAKTDAGAHAPLEVWSKSTWGSGPGQLGRDRRPEGNAEGPMSLTASRNGELLVLDQANGRLARYGADGKFKDSVPLTVQSAQDVVQSPDGKSFVLDRLADGAVAILDPDGKQVGELPLLGVAVKEGGAVTGLFVDGEDVYVEQEHGVLNRIGDIKGKADQTQPEVPGRPTRDGRSFISAGIVDGAAGRLFVSAIDRQAMAQRFTREYRLPPRVSSIALLDTDGSGIIYLAVLLEPPEGKEAVQLMCLDPLDGRPLGGAVLPANTLPEETFRDFAVLDNGGVIYSFRTEEGVELRRYDCR